MEKYKLEEIILNKKDYTSNWQCNIGISFDEVKKITGVDLLKLRRVGLTIILDEQKEIVLNFLEHWKHFNDKLFLTNGGALVLFENYSKVYLNFLRKYTMFERINQLSNELNIILEKKKYILAKEYIKRRQFRAYLKKIEEDSYMQIEYLQNILPNLFLNKKGC